MIADSGPLLAALDRRDRHHAVAVQVLRAARHEVQVPDPVIVEVDIVARRWLGPEVARAFLRSVRDGVHQRTLLTDRMWRRAVELDVTYGDLDLGLADTSVMAVAEAHRSPVLTFDFRAFRAVVGPVNGTWDLVVTEADLS